MNGITTIQIGDQPVTLRFAYNSFKKFSLAQTADPDNFWTEPGGQGSLTDYAYGKLFYFAYANDCLIHDTKPVLKFVDFYDWVNERLDSPELGEVIKVWAESATTKRAVESVAKKKEELSRITEVPVSTLNQSNEPVTELLESGHGNLTE